MLISPKSPLSPANRLLSIRKRINSTGFLLSQFIILISPILATLFVSTCLFSIFCQNFNTLFLIPQCLLIVVRRISETFLFPHASKPLATNDDTKTHACTPCKKPRKACDYVLDTTSFHSGVTCQTFTFFFSKTSIVTLQILSTSSPVAGVVSNMLARQKTKRNKTKQNKTNKQTNKETNKKPLN